MSHGAQSLRIIIFQWPGAIFVMWKPIPKHVCFHLKMCLLAIEKISQGMMVKIYGHFAIEVKSMAILHWCGGTEMVPHSNWLVYWRPPASSPIGSQRWATSTLIFRKWYAIWTDYSDLSGTWGHIWTWGWSCALYKFTIFYLVVIDWGFIQFWQYRIVL